MWNSLKHQDTLLFAVCIGLHLVPIWAFPYFPSQDGPAHLNNAAVLRDYYSPAGAILREYYIVNMNPNPNWFSHSVLAMLMLVVPAGAAEKLLLSGYIILLPVSVRYAVRGIRAESGFLAIFGFPFIYNYLFHKGFYNFVYSLAAYFFLVGYWARHHERFALRRTMVLAVLSLLLYFCHPVSLVTAWLLVGVFALGLTIQDTAVQLRDGRVRLKALWNAFRNRALMPLCALLPTLILASLFLSQQGTTLSDRGENLWYRLYRLDSLVSYGTAEGIYSTALVMVFVAVTAYLVIMKGVCRTVSRWDGLLFVVALYVVIYFIAPTNMSGGGFIDYRMNLFPFLGLILWFAAQTFHHAVKWATQAAIVAISLILLGMHTATYAELNDYLKEYLTVVEVVEPNSTLLPLSFSQQGRAPDGRMLSRRVRVFLHAAGHIGAQRRVVELNNYEADTSHFPISWRPELNPFTHIGDIEGEPPSVDFRTYSQRTKGRVDYVLLWGMSDRDREHPRTKSILAQLQEGYELTYTSQQRGYVQLYRRRN